MTEVCADCRKNGPLLALSFSFIRQMLVKYEGGNTTSLRKFNFQLESEYSERGFNRGMDAGPNILSAHPAHGAGRAGSRSPGRNAGQRKSPVKIKDTELSRDKRGSPDGAASGGRSKSRSENGNRDQIAVEVAV